jgi:deferrochelatase/peroxidase EfeB
MAEPDLPIPLPMLDGAHQPGIIDPIWPEQPAVTGVDLAIYAAQYAGRTECQRHLHLIEADVDVSTADELRDVLKMLWGFAKHQMEKRPPSGRKYDKIPASRRLTVTVGFGATLFATAAGDDRFGILGLKPHALKVMPRIEGDEEFDPRKTTADLVIVLQSDDFYVNEYVFGRLYYGVIPSLRIKRVERGYARPDSREPSGFEDGLTNPKELRSDQQASAAVFITDADQEPSWCTGGTYMAYRKVRRRMAKFFEIAVEAQQDQVFGVERHTGARLATAAVNAHAQKMNPRRATPDLLGVRDEARRIVRRPFFFNDGLDAQGNEVRGVHHISFTRNLIGHYEWPVLMWQTNPNFPVPNAGRDALYGIRGGAANISGGYYFLPANPGKGEGYGHFLEALEKR